jgi:hypothetical protein
MNKGQIRKQWNRKRQARQEGSVPEQMISERKNSEKQAGDDNGSKPKMVPVKRLSRRLPSCHRHAHGIQYAISHIHAPHAQSQHKRLTPADVDVQIPRQKNLPKHRDERRVKTEEVGPKPQLPLP